MHSILHTKRKIIGKQENKDLELKLLFGKRNPGNLHENSENQKFHHSFADAPNKEIPTILQNSTVYVNIESKLTTQNKKKRENEKDKKKI